MGYKGDSFECHVKNVLTAWGHPNKSCSHLHWSFQRRRCGLFKKTLDHSHLGWSGWSMNQWWGKKTREAERKHDMREAHHRTGVSDSSKDNSFLAHQQRPRQLWGLLNPAFTLRRRSVLSMLSSLLTKWRLFPPPLALNLFLLHYTFPFAFLSLSIHFFFSLLANANDSPAVWFTMDFPSLKGWGKVADSANSEWKFRQLYSA